MIIIAFSPLARSHRPIDTSFSFGGGGGGAGQDEDEEEAINRWLRQSLPFVRAQLVELCES